MDLLASSHYDHSQSDSQEQRDGSIDNNSDKEDYTHNSLLNPLPSYISKTSSLKSQNKSDDDTIPVPSSIQSLIRLQFLLGG